MILQNKKRVLVFGNQKVCIGCIEVLRKNPKINIGFVVGCELPRDNTIGYPSVEKYCKKVGLTYYNPKLLDETMFKRIKSYQPDFCFSFYYRNIFKENFINLPTYGFINLHHSLLPKFRGPAATLWTLLNGESITGATLLYIDRGIDTGDIIAQNKVNIPNNITGFQLNDLMMDKGVALFKDQLKLILENKNKRVKQGLSGASYFGSYTPSVGLVDWHQSKLTIERKIRALTRPYNGSYSYLRGKKIVIWNAEVLSKNLNTSGGPGRVMKNNNGTLTVTTVDGYIELLDYNIEGLSNKSRKFIRVGNRFDI